MAKTSTQNQAFLYVYNELSPEDTRHFEAELLFSNSLQEEVEGLMQIKNVLGKLKKMDCSDRTVQNILSYSKAHKAVKLSNGQHADLILN